MGGMLIAASHPVLFLEMRSADKVILVETVNGAYLYAFSATRTKGIIYCCKIVFNLDRAVRTGLLAFHTADTTVCADLAGDSALVVI